MKKGLGVYKIFLKNKIASSVMMFVSGIMMFIAAVNGNGNDTWSLPALITTIGVLLSLWGAFRLGYMKAHFDMVPKTEEQKRKLGLKSLGMQALETLLYMAVAGLGVFRIRH